MAITTSVRDYVTLLAKSKLVPADEAEAHFKAWADGTGDRNDADVDSFRKFLVGRRVLTDYQGHMIQRGHADGFFLWDYKILDRIGKGQMGGVYKAVHALGQVVALKILPGSKARDPHLLGRFQREARLLTQLDHPNVVRAYQLGNVAGVHFIAMEFLEGETVDEVLLRRKRLPAGEAVRLVRQAFDGLQHLHEKRMVHRDLKPSNLMLVPAADPRKGDTTWDATVKILDIGLGRELFAEGTPDAQIETQLTVEGAVLGTPDYLAPEQARDARSSDIRADIYSLGCVLYRGLAGHPPFPDTNIMTQMLRHATEPPPPLPDAPPGLQAVMDRLLAKDPAERYPTPAEAAAALRPFEPPNTGKPAAAADVVPAYKEWLELESSSDIVPVIEDEPPAPPPPPPAARPAPPPPPPATPQAATKPAAAIKTGTAPAKPVAPPPRPPPAAAKPAPPPPPPAKAAPAPRPQKPAAAKPPPTPPPAEEEIDVELVTFPPPAPPPLPVSPPPAPAPLPLDELPPQPLPVPVRDDRPLWEWNRRDLFMLATGVVGALAAVGLGYGLAQVARKKDGEGK